MKTVTIKLPLLLFTVVYAVPQQQPLGVSVGDRANRAFLLLGMTRQEVVKKLSSCCQIVPLGETGALVTL
jgi:hypothetical protein